MPCGARSTTGGKAFSEVSAVRARHHPKASERNDGSWMVNCPECAQADEVPIGIGMALESQLTAERLIENHRAGTYSPTSLGELLAEANPQAPTPTEAGLLSRVAFAVARWWEVHRSLFAIRDETGSGLVPSLPDRVQIDDVPMSTPSNSGASPLPPDTMSHEKQQTNNDWARFPFRQSVLPSNTRRPRPELAGRGRLTGGAPLGGTRWGLPGGLAGSRRASESVTRSATF